MSISKKIPQFWRRVSIVLVGTVAAQAIPLAILPLLTRMLSPELVGQYFIWLGIATVTSVVASFRLDIAIFNAKTPNEIASLLRAAIITALTFGLLLLGLVLALAKFSPDWLSHYGVKAGTFEAVCMAALLAINQTVLAAYVYNAMFARQAIAKILLTGSVALAQLTLVATGYGVKGMIIGQVSTTAFIAFLLLLDVRRCLALNSNAVKPTPYLTTLKANWRFPVFAMPADFINSFSAQLPLFIIGSRFSGAVAGQYGLTNRTLAAPVGLLAGSVLSVFKEEASREYRDMRQCRRAYVKAFRALALLGIVPFVIILFSSKYLFVLVFGPEWLQAGQLAALLAPMFYLKFVASPLSYTLYLANRQSHDLIWQLGLMTMTACTFIFFSDIYLSVATYSAGYSCLYLIYILMSYKAAKGK